MIADVTPITDSQAANRGRGMMKTGKSLVMRKWHGTAVLLVAVIFALSILPALASAAVTSDIYVNETGWWRDGGAFNTSNTRIQAAIDNATAGETIYVYNGTYDENVNVNKQVTLQGEGNDVVNVAADSVSDHVFEVTADYVNISGFNVTGAGDATAGIYLGNGVDHCTISNNTASNNICGILLNSSSNNTLSNNNAAGNFGGIGIESSSNNMLSNNKVPGNLYYGIGIWSSSNNTLTSNTANSNNFAGIYLESSSNNTLTSNNASNNSNGICLVYSSYNTLLNNNASNNYFGIYLGYSSNNTLTSNTANSNNDYGIWLRYSSNNTLRNNNADSNNDSGILLESSSNNTLTSNNADLNTISGINLYSSSSYNTLTGNNVSNNSNCGIVLYDSSNNTLTSNNVSANSYGICLDYSNNNMLMSNNVSNNGDGIGLDSSSYNTLTNNKVDLNNDYGIGLDSSSYNTLTSNNASNNGAGIWLYDSCNNTLTDNNADSNDFVSIWLYGSSNNTLTSNTANSNNDYGIYLILSSDNTIYNNYFNNTNNAYDDGNNTWNTTPTPGINIIGGSLLGGNYWSDYAGADTNDDGLGNTLTPYNSSGNITNGGDHHPLTLDNTDPAITIATPTTSSIAYKSGGQQMYVNFTYVEANPKNYTIQIRNATDIINSTTDTTTSSPVNVSFMMNSTAADGYYNVTVTMRDNATNTNTTIEVDAVLMDSTPPNAPTIDVPANGETLASANTWVNGTTDTDTANVTVYVNGSIKNVSVAVSGNTFNISNVPLGADGAHEINVSAMDAAGNVNTTNASVTVNVDTTAPIISIVTPTASSKVSKKGGQQIYVNFTYVEANPKNYTVQIRNATAIINSTTDTTTSPPVNVSFTMNATAAEGYYNVTVTMWDNASYTNTATEDNAVIIDTTPPTSPTNLIHTDDAPNGYDNDNSTDISWSPSTDVSTVIYRIYKNGTLIDSTESTVYTFTNEIEDPHPHEYNVSAIDSAGNINTTNASVKVIVDYTDPVIHNVSLSDNTTSYGQKIVVSVNATDTITNITSVTAGGTQLTHQSGMLWNGTITAVYGTNIITVTAYDNASHTAINDSLSYTGPAAPTDNGGSRGGGGVSGSDEPDNVEESAILRLYLASGSSSTYNFNNVITSVEVTPERTYGLVAAKIEVLYGQPGSITTDPPNGVLFKYVNIFVGTSGWSEGKFSSSVINFQVPASWFNENNIDPALVTMYKHKDGEWQPLATTLTGQVGEYYQYSSPTPGFSTFMILGQVEESSSGEPAVATDSGTVAEPTPTPEATSTKGTPGFGILVGIMGIMMAVYSRKK